MSARQNAKVIFFSGPIHHGGWVDDIQRLSGRVDAHMGSPLLGHPFDAVRAFESGQGSVRVQVTVHRLALPMVSVSGVYYPSASLRFRAAVRVRRAMPGRTPARASRPSRVTVKTAPLAASTDGPPSAPGHHAHAASAEGGLS